jgi:small subunit ribosomal protein S16
MKKFGRNKRPFFRICAIDSRAPRDGKVIEELGHYDPLVKDTDARAILNGERIAYWLSVGALPSENVQVLIKNMAKAAPAWPSSRRRLRRSRRRARRPPRRTFPRPSRPNQNPPRKHLLPKRRRKARKQRRRPNSELCVSTS